jgi:hypothetical protein
MNLNHIFGAVMLLAIILTAGMVWYDVGYRHNIDNLSRNNQKKEKRNNE